MMRKREHGRLVHELRAALIRHGFKPTRVTRLDGPGGTGVRAPGFALLKHQDGKSVRLSCEPARRPAREGWAGRQSQGEAQLRLLLRYHASLEREGFVCADVCSRDPLGPYSLWRRG